MNTRRKKTYRYSFDSSGNFLGATEVNPISLYVRRGLMLLALFFGLSFVVGQGCLSTTQANYNPKSELAAPQVQLPL